MSEETRSECLVLIYEAVQSGARKFKACEVLDLNLRTIERWEKKPRDGRKGPIQKPKNALSENEREAVLRVCNQLEYANLTPWKIVPKLADMGLYLGSESSFYRILKERSLLTHRSKSKPRAHHKPKELIALSPNQVWSWDITYLKTVVRGKYYYLYLPMDIYSRKIVHWEVHETESAEQAGEMIIRACEKEGVKKNEVKLHSDNGSPMKGATMLATMEKLGVIPSFSRPGVSNDNPYSESLFRTLKYDPTFPDQAFKNLEEAKSWVENFVDWYNNEHLHSGISYVTPASRHSGEDVKILRNRDEVYKKAQARNPIRWGEKTRNWEKKETVVLNPDKVVSMDQVTL